MAKTDSALVRRALDMELAFEDGFEFAVKGLSILDAEYVKPLIEYLELLFKSGKNAYVDKIVERLENEQKKLNMQRN